MNDTSIVDWVAAVGQVVGALGTLAAVIVALAIARRDGKRLERDRRDRDSAQARLITSRLDDDWREITGGRTSTIIVRNNSSQAIANLYIVEAVAPGTGFRWVSAGQAETGEDIVEANSASEFRGQWEGPAATGTGAGNGITAVDIRIQFVDSSGLWWQRVNNGDLVRSQRRRPTQLQWMTRPDTT